MLEALPAFTSLACVICYVRYKRQKEKIPQRQVRGWLVASAVFLGLTAASKYLYCVVGIAILADWLLAGGEDRKSKQLLMQIGLWSLIALLVFFIADPYLWPSPIVRLKESILYHASYAQGAQEVQSADFPIWQPMIWLALSCPWQPEVFIFRIDILIAILAFVGISPLWKKERVYGLWMLIALVFLFLWPTKWPQYVLVLTAPLSLAAGEGLKTIVNAPIQAITARRGKKQEKANFSLRETILSVPWLLPGMITLAVLIAFPLTYQLAMSLTDFSAVSIKDGINGGIWRQTWLGLTGQIKPIIQNSASTQVHYQGVNLFRYIFSAIPQALVFELLWTVLSVGLQAVLGIGTALLLNQKGIRFRNLWRTIFLLPWAIPEFVGALIWLRTFDPTAGWVTQAFGTSGGSGGSVMISKVLEAGGQNLAFLLLLIAGTWIGFPFIMLAASASLKMIPEDVYDAAAIDGAAKWSLFKFVTWPLLLPLVVPALIIRAILAFNQFYLFYVFFPAPRYEMFGTFSYFSYIVFKWNGDYAFSATINIVTMVILIILLVLFNRWSKASEGVTYA